MDLPLPFIVKTLESARSHVLVGDAAFCERLVLPNYVTGDIKTAAAAAYAASVSNARQACTKRMETQFAPKQPLAPVTETSSASSSSAGPASGKAVSPHLRSGARPIPFRPPPSRKGKSEAIEASAPAPAPAPPSQPNPLPDDQQYFFAPDSMYPLAQTLQNATLFPTYLRQHNGVYPEDYLEMENGVRTLSGNHSYFTNLRAIFPMPAVSRVTFLLAAFCAEVFCPITDPDLPSPVTILVLEHEAPFYKHDFPASLPELRALVLALDEIAVALSMVGEDVGPPTSIFGRYASCYLHSNYPTACKMAFGDDPIPPCFTLSDCLTVITAASAKVKTTLFTKKSTAHRVNTVSKARQDQLPHGLLVTGKFTFHMALLDTGSSINLVGSSLVAKGGDPSYPGPPCTITFGDVNGRTMTSSTYVTRPLRLNNRPDFDVELLVLDDFEAVIIGYPCITQHSISVVGDAGPSHHPSSSRTSSQ